MTSKEWQLGDNAAQRYQDILVPTILGPFAEALVKWALIEPDMTVVDVGCGTGAATRYAAQKLGASGTVIGVDVNPGMLKVAESIAIESEATIEWREASAYELPFDDESVDVVLCAQTLQFLSDRPKAIEEMYRILKPEGSAYVSLWRDIKENPYFDALVKTIATSINKDTAAGLGTAFNLSNIKEIETLFKRSSFDGLQTTMRELKLPLPPVNDFVPLHINATPMGAGFNAASEETQDTILTSLQIDLSDYKTTDGMTIPFSSYLVQAIK